MKSHRDIGRRRGPTPRDSGRGEGVTGPMTLAGPSAALGTGAPRAGNRCEKAIALPGVLGLPEIRVWLPRPEARSPYEMPMPSTSSAAEFG